MAEQLANRAEEEQEDEGGGGENAEGTIKTVYLLEEMSRKEKRKAKKKMKRKQMRKDMAEKEREEDEARLNDPEEQRRLRMIEEEEKERVERERKEFEERERAWIEAMERKRKEEEEKEEEERRKALVEEESNRLQVENVDELNEGDHWEYVEEGPAEIIWQGNEIIVKKKRIRVPKKDAKQQSSGENAERPTSNPLPPQSEAYADYKHASVLSAEQSIENVGQQVPNFGTEQYTDEEVEHCYEEFYEDVHTEFLKFGEIVNFKVRCEFVNVTRWKVAICGEYMKSRFKTCSHGTACNFIHCFRNPGGEAMNVGQAERNTRTRIGS
ncbi:Zinc finger CCCH domain-containing protein 5 [Morella rubra]|uniref:Zinc finger CCCH domain-containing protein 5 n=1 Tax=Morella rubra TaxID=262757 RepID=A0A6A1V9R5_9ROSI|nr:Zinc finger CCCH domain-containing protein 5 [Morella rubra]